MNIGIVGCGLIGVKRSRNLLGHKVTRVADYSREKADALAAEHPGAQVMPSFKELVVSPDVDAVIVATTHDALARITIAALDAGKHVLVEKPGGRTPEEIRGAVRKANEKKLVVKAGFNHRFHPALQKAHEIFSSGVLGPMMFIRGRYGHGARPGYDREWRADAKISGGGEAIDQGVHLIDLSRWFLGDFATAVGYTPTYFWDMKVEDNAFFLLKTRTGQAAWLHASWTEWKNMFSFEIYGRHGKLQIDGLGGSYGTEKLTYYKMLPQMGPPEVTVWEYPGPDESWSAEFANFVAAIEGRAPVCGGLGDTLAAMEIVHQVYAQR